MRSRTTERLTRALFLSVILIAALWLRVNDIGKFGFWRDEYYHVFAAKSLIEDGSLHVPFHGNYTRAKPVTYITAWSFKLLGESEVSARLPFAFINVFFILVGYLMLRKLFSEKIALAFAFVMSFSPFAIEMSRECRMYAAFQFLYFATTVVFFSGYESMSRRWKFTRDSIATFETRYGISLSLLLFSAFLFWASVSLHELSYNFGLVVLTYSTVLFTYYTLHGGLRKAFSSKYSILLLMSVLCILTILLFRHEFLFSMLLTAMDIPTWAWYTAGDYNYYRWLLQLEYPALFFFYPIGAYFLIRNYGKRGLFFVLSFATLILFHSFFFGRRGDRYIFYTFPFFVVGAACALENIILPSILALTKLIETKHISERFSLVLLAIPAAFLFLHPWFTDSWRVHLSWRFADWKSFPVELKEEIVGGKVITTDPMEFRYYFKRDPDYFFVAKDERHQRYNYGKKLITSFDQLKNIVDESPKLFFVGDKFRVHNNAFLDDSMRDYMSENMLKSEGSFDRKILLFTRGL